MAMVKDKVILNCKTSDFRYKESFSIKNHTSPFEDIEKFQILAKTNEENVIIGVIITK